MRILVADDEVTSRALLAAMLRQQGFTPVEATDGLEAWDVLRGEDAPSIAVLDWMMPGIDGLEVVRRLRVLPSGHRTYVLILTSKDRKADIVTALQAGADDFLSKPFDAGELKARIDVGCRVIEMQAQMERQLAELRDALEHIKTLQGILPICSFCKSIRDDEGYWGRVEAYISNHLDVQFSHSICPTCMQEHYPEQWAKIKDKLEK